MKINVCIITFTLSEVGLTPLSKLLKLFSTLANKVYVFSGAAAFNVYNYVKENLKKLEALRKILNNS